MQQQLLAASAAGSGSASSNYLLHCCILSPFSVLICFSKIMIVILVFILILIIDSCGSNHCPGELAGRDDRDRMCFHDEKSERGTVHDVHQEPQFIAAYPDFIKAPETLKMKHDKRVKPSPMKATLPLDVTSSSGSSCFLFGSLSIWIWTISFSSKGKSALKVDGFWLFDSHNASCSPRRHCGSQVVGCCQCVPHKFVSLLETSGEREGQRQTGCV